MYRAILFILLLTLISCNRRVIRPFSEFPEQYFSDYCRPNRSESCLSLRFHPNGRLECLDGEFPDKFKKVGHGKFHATLGKISVSSANCNFPGYNFHSLTCTYYRLERFLDAAYYIECLNEEQKPLILNIRDF